MNIGLGCVLALVACGSDGGELGAFHEQSSGIVCLHDAIDAEEIRGQFQVGAPIYLTFSPDVCLSSSCSPERMATCSVAVDGATFTIETASSWYDAPKGAACTDDCTAPSGVCQTPPLPAGAYTFVAHGHVQAVSVPERVADVGDNGCFSN